MPFDAHQNFAYSVITVAPTPAASGTSLDVQDASVFPAVPFNVTIWPDGEVPLSTNAEIVRVTNISGSTLTITREQEGSTARSIQVGDQIALTVTKKIVEDIEAAIPSTAGLISYINVSAGATSNNLSAITFSNSNGLAFGLSASTITGSYTVPTVTAGSDTFGISNLGNTAGTSGVVSADQVRVLFAGGNNVTLSQSINGASATITISGANTSAQQTGISGIIASDATYTSGTVQLTGVGGGVTVSSNTGQRVDISVAAQSVQTQNLIAASLSGNTAGALALVSSGTLILAGGNNITVSQNGQSVTISGPNAGGAQTGISGIIVSDATYTSGTVSFSNAGNITISSSVNGATQYIRLSGNAAQTTQSAIKGFGVSNTGNTAGNTGISTGIDWVIAATQSLTVSQSTTAGGPNTVWLSVGAYLTTAMASNRGSDFVQANANFNGTNATGTIASNAISVSVAAPIPIATAVKAVASIGSTGTITRYAPEDHQHAGVAAFAVTNTGNTLGNTRSQVGTFYIAASGAITASQSTAAAGNDTVWLSVAAQTNQSAIKGLGASNTGNTAGNTGISTGIDWVLAGSNNITISESTAGGGPNTLWVSGPNLTQYLTTAALSGDTTKYMQAWELTGNTAGTTSSLQGTKIYFSGGNSITVSGNSNTIVMSVGNYITTARASTDAIGLNTAKTNVTWTVNSSGLSLDAGGYAGTVTSGHNATITVNSSGVTVSVAPPGAAAEANNINLLGNNTAGNTTASGSTIGWSGGNGVTLSGTNNSQVVISVNTYSTVGTATTVYSVASANSVGTVTRWAAEDHRHAGVGGIGISTGNTFGTSGSVLGTYWLAGSNNISLSQITSNNGSHTLVVYNDAALSQYDPFPETPPVTNSTLGQSTVYFVPFDVLYAISASRINFYLSLTHTYSGAPNNQTASMRLGYALYTRGGGTNSDRISTVTSYALPYISASVSSSTRLSVTNYIGLSNATSHSTSQYGVNNASVSDYLGSSIAGFRAIALPLNMTLTPGRYWLAFSNQSASQNGSIVFAHTIVQQQVSNQIAFRPIGNVSAASNASVWGANDGFGTYSAQTAAFPDTIPLTASAIRQAPVGTFPRFNFSGIGTSTNIL